MQRFVFGYVASAMFVAGCGPSKEAKYKQALDFYNAESAALETLTKKLDAVKLEWDEASKQCKSNVEGEFFMARQNIKLFYGTRSDEDFAAMKAEIEKVAAAAEAEGADMTKDNVATVLVRVKDNIELGFFERDAIAYMEINAWDARQKQKFKQFAPRMDDLKREIETQQKRVDDAKKRKDELAQN